MGKSTARLALLAAGIVTTAGAATPVPYGPPTWPLPASRYRCGLHPGIKGTMAVAKNYYGFIRGDPAG